MVFFYINLMFKGEIFISRRGYNIDSLSVWNTNDPEVSRMTISLNGDDDILEQFQKQLKKLVETISVENLKPEDAVYRKSRIKPKRYGVFFRVKNLNLLNSEIVDFESTRIANIKVSKDTNI